MSNRPTPAQNALSQSHITSDLSSSGIRGLYATVDELKDRMGALGLLDHKEITEAIATVESAESVPHLADQFAFEVLRLVTGSDDAAREITKRLVNSQSDALFAMGQDGLVVRNLGGGACGDVHLVHLYGNQGNAGLHALKVSKQPQGREDPRFKREIGIMEKHTTRNGNGSATILPTYAECGTYDLPDMENGEHAPRLTYSMEFLQGRTLGDVLEEVEETGKPIHPQIATDLLIRLVKMIRDFKGHSHRDIKPDNIMILDDEGRPRLLDCGFAVGDISSDRVTQTAIGLGTPLYMSPEAWKDGKHADKLSDLYSAAATVYHLTTGKPPVLGENRMDMIQKLLQNQRPDFSIISPSNFDATQEFEHGLSGTADESLTHTQTTLDVHAPVLHKTLDKMLQFSRAERTLADYSERAISISGAPYPDLALSDEEIREECDRWLHELIPYSSFSEKEVYHGDPGLFSAAESLPSEEEVEAGDTIGSMYTRAQLHAILSGDMGIKTNAEPQPQPVPKRSYARQSLFAAAGASILITVGGIAYWLSTEKVDAEGVKPKVKIAAKEDPSTKANIEPKVPDNIVEPPKVPEVNVTMEKPVHFEWEINEHGERSDIRKMKILLNEKTYSIDKDALFHIFNNDPSQGREVEAFAFETKDEKENDVLQFGYVYDTGCVLLLLEDGRAIGVKKDGTLAFQGKLNGDNGYNPFIWVVNNLKNGGPIYREDGRIPSNLQDQVDFTRERDLMRKLSKRFVEWKENLRQELIQKRSPSQSR